MNAFITITILLLLLPQAKALEAVTGEFVVKLPSTSNTQVERLKQNSSIKSLDEKGRVYLVQRPLVERPTFGFMSLQEQLPKGTIVEPNYIYSIDSLPDDPFLNLQPNLVGKISSNQLDCQGQPLSNVKSVGMEGVYNMIDEGEATLVAVVDTGVDLSHQDLQGQIFVNQVELRGEPGVDDDGNGYVDDIQGLDVVKQRGSAQDDHGHGTHVAGIIAANTNNGTGMAGISSHSQILPVKFLTASGSGTLADAITALQYAAKMGAQVINASWGGGGRSEVLKSAIQDLADAGILFVAAAGNSGSDNDRYPTYPASYQVANVVSVASTRVDGSLAESSNYGSQTVHIAAPGENIFSSVLNGYDCYSGTSMATPHVSGALALAISQMPNESTAAIKGRLLLTAEALDSLKETSVTGGFLRVDRLLGL